MHIRLYNEMQASRDWEEFEERAQKLLTALERSGCTYGWHCPKVNDDMPENAQRVCKKLSRFLTG